MDDNQTGVGIETIWFCPVDGTQNFELPTHSNQGKRRFMEHPHQRDHECGKMLASGRP